MEVYDYNHNMPPVSNDGSSLGDEPDRELAALFGDDENGDLASLFTEVQSPANFDAASESPAGWSWMEPSSSVFPTFSQPSQEETALASPSLPCEEEQIPQHDQVSTQNPAVYEQTPSEAELELELQLELALQEELNIDSPQAETMPRHDAQACHDAPVLEQVGTEDFRPERRTRRPAVRSSPLLPPRIDLECPNIEAMLPCINLTTGMTNAKIFERLGFDNERGNLLMAHAKEYLAQPEHAIDIVGQQDPDYRRKTKTAVINAALSLLVVDSWGEQWFSPGPFRSENAELIWPNDSTEIFYRFIPILYKLARNSKQRKYAARTREQTMSRAAVRPSPAPSTPGSLTAPSPEPAPCISRSPSLPVGLQSANPMGYVSIRTRRPAAEIDTPDNGLEGPPSKRVRRVDAAQHMQSETLVIPELTYIINIMEGPHRIIPPVTLHRPHGFHTPVFYDLLTRVAELDKFAVIEVYTADGLVPISEEGSWNEAIRTIYTDESMDRTVRVRIRIVEPVILDG